MKLKRLSPQTPLEKLFKKLNVTCKGAKIMEKKADLILFWVENIQTPAANILKQDALSIGADFAVPAGVICCEEPLVNGVLIGHRTHMETLIQKEKVQPFGLKEFSSLLEQHLTPKTHHPVQIMGIINANDNSFFSGSRFMGDPAFHAIEQMIEDGAHIIDIGAVSTAPGSAPVSEEEELSRIEPILKTIQQNTLYEKALFSIDSYTPTVIQKALDSGFKIVNDITGLENDAVARLAGEYNATCAIMHMQGTPQTMQNNPHYDDLIGEIDSFFESRIQKAQEFGIKQLILDPGIGFGKTLQHNLTLLKHLNHFEHFGYPLLIGASRKSMIDKVIPTPAEKRLPGTLAIHLKALDHGASIIRCHDVPEHVQAIALWQSLHEIDTPC